AQKRYLTKSRFKLASECPTKLYYTKKAEYADQKIEDSFLLALADGGFQVGELAKLYFPGGHDIKSLDYEASLAETNAMLAQDQVIIYEAAIATEKLFIRADILVKDGDHLSLYEVKSKSYDGNEGPSFTKNDGTILASWKSYLYDVAFQKYVIKEAFPQYTVSAHLMMADTSSLCPTDGLNQKFRLVTDTKGRKSVQVSESLTEEDLSSPILCTVNVDDLCTNIYEGSDGEQGLGLPFVERVTYFAEQYASDTKIVSPVTSVCATCEFTTTDADEQKGLFSGMKECWKERLGWTDMDFASPTVLDIWNYRGKDKLIQENKIKMGDVTECDIKAKEDDKPGLSTTERQWLQVKKSQSHDQSVWLDRMNLQREIHSWIFPLHFIDFETSMAAIPFNKGRRPYEGIAFQFSHHTVQRDGTITHVGEYLNTTPGFFPNYEFVRALKAQLDGDSGSIFKYSNHENSYLNMIYRQLQHDKDSVTDYAELCSFIRSITKSVHSSPEWWEGERNMIDMLEVVKRYYYDPATNGSNSIKAVLPAILNSSDFLKEKYSKPIYGSQGGIPSLNFRDWQWLTFKDGKVVDPYMILPKMFGDISDKDMGQLISVDDELHNGGAALTAYARMQFEQMGDYEREEIRKALLKYCELDTMAMVMLYEGWLDLLGAV
ncbi:MAG TPA: DUF2779 domain-containing protein, partial [Sphaerochaeta sp.]|nr:DUF2779 domain-containing protein [Sphaerochaeta sp.]